MSDDAPKTRRPEWAKGSTEDGFTSFVTDGVSDVTTSRPPIKAPAKLSVADYIQGVKNGERSILSRAITLAESNKEEHMTMAEEMLQELLPYSGKSMRIGFTGVPGAGKSTVIEAVGLYLCNKGHKVAVLAVDPSSTVTKGSILGDKTRMAELSRHPNAFIRPSPSSGTLGGVARKSRESLLLCEAAGYDIVIVETVGVGQSETTVRSMVDCFLYIVLTGAGDELQGIKKGIMELADIIAVNKADGDNKQKAVLARADYERIIHYLRPATEGWITPALTCSAYTGEGIEELWQNIEKFFAHVRKEGIFDTRRQSQELSWMFAMVEEYLYRSFFNDDTIKKLLPAVKEEIINGKTLPTRAARQLLMLYENKKEE